MKAYQILTSISIVLLLLACKTTQDYSQGGKHYNGSSYEGAKFTPKSVMTYDQLLSKMKKKGGAEDVQVIGMIDATCQKRGCWMTMISPTPGKDTMFVKFKDYAFFMPKDLPGNTVIMHGDAYYEETSVEELRHYAEDAGKSKEDIMKIVKPIREVKFLADGVLFKN